jgi:hypothetical protein
MGNLLEYGAKLQTNRRKLVWVDPYFKGGRIHSRYRKVPSNTKASLFVQFAHDVAAFRTIVNTTLKPNALTALQELPQDQGCSLSYAADMCLMLTQGLKRHPNVLSIQAKVKSAVLNEQTGIWTVGFEDGYHVITPKLFLCTGSIPIWASVSTISRKDLLNLEFVDLDDALDPSKLAKAFDREVKATVAVIGASHSAILVLMNLVALASSTHPHLRIKWFTRHKLRYAEYMDGWILRDNTGLKGQAAEWAHQNLDDEKLPHSPAGKFITKVSTAGGKEEEVYASEMPECTHLLQAVGYSPAPLPRIEIIGKDGSSPRQLKVGFDNSNGRFFEENDSSSPNEKIYVPGLYGAGIAFPERVTDPHGNVEYAVGFWKFMKFVKRVVPSWVYS